MEGENSLLRQELAIYIRDIIQPYIEPMRLPVNLYYTLAEGIIKRIGNQK